VNKEKNSEKQGQSLAHYAAHSFMRGPGINRRTPRRIRPR